MKDRFSPVADIRTIRLRAISDNTAYGKSGGFPTAGRRLIGQRGPLAPA